MALARRLMQLTLQGQCWPPAAIEGTAWPPSSYIGHVARKTFFGKQPPRASRPQHEDDTGEGGAVRDVWAASLEFRRPLRQQQFDGYPEIVRDKRRAHGKEESRQPSEFCNTLSVSV